jgi:hypothetical protein
MWVLKHVLAGIVGLISDDNSIFTVHSAVVLKGTYRSTQVLGWDERNASANL